MNVFGSGAIEYTDDSFAVDEYRHSTAPTCACLLLPCRLFGRERFAVISGLRYPNLPRCFTLRGCGCLPMPCHVDVTRRIGCDASPAIQTKGAGHQIAF